MARNITYFIILNSIYIRLLTTFDFFKYFNNTTIIKDILSIDTTLGVHCVMGLFLRLTSILRSSHNFFPRRNYSLLQRKPFIRNSRNKNRITTSTSTITTTTTRTMSSDAYLSFLEKANSDLRAGQQPQTQTQTQQARTETVDVNAQIPASLASVDAYYVSETDEPFEPVVLRFEGAKRGDWPGPCTPPFLVYSLYSISDCSG